MTSDDGTGQDGRTRALLRDLHALGRLDDHTEAFGQDLRARLLMQARHQTAQHNERMPHMATILPRPRTVAFRWPQMRLRVASVAAAVLLALSGVAGYLRWQTPTPVSAQTILRQTAVALQPAELAQVTHDISAVHVVNAPGVSSGVSGLTAPDVTVDEWTQRDVRGTIVRQDTMFTDPHGSLLQHTVQNGRTLKIYNAQVRVTTVTIVTPSAPAPNQVIPNPFDTASLRQFVLDAQQGTNKEARVLPQQTLDGAAVYVVQVTHTPPSDPQANATTPHQYAVTLYIDQGSYAVHKIDIAVVNTAGNVVSSTTLQVVRHEVVPATDVPMRIFSLHAPAGTRVIRAPGMP